jgi:hypothetical protein
VRWVVTLLTAASASFGCSDDPSGPGTLDLVIRGPVPLGAAVVQITGMGVIGVDQPAVGWAELVPMAPVGSTPVHRLVLVQEQAGELRVRLRVVDVAALPPVVSVIEAADQADVPLASLSSVEARIRP